MILAGDVGGTKTDLALFEEKGGHLVEKRGRRFESRRYPDLATVLREFLADDVAGVERAGFGVPGPVVDGRGQATNLTWVVDVHDLERLLEKKPVTLVNDLVATAAGVLDLPDERLVTLHPGRSRPAGTRAVLAPGTGLGESALFWNGNGYHAMPSEGGHADFAARDLEEIALVEHLLRTQKRVSYEHLLGGPAFSRIYDFLRDTGRATEPEAVARELARAADRNAAITRLAMTEGVEICVRALDRWAAILGAEAGNLALRTVAEGGVYLAGGIVGQLVESLRHPAFLAAFLAKEPLDGFVKDVPVRVVLEERTALLGAARLASRT